MFNFSQQQQRERLLMVVAGFVLLTIIVMFLPAQFRELDKLKTTRQQLLDNIAEHERAAQDKDEIQRRLSEMEGQSLAFTGQEAIQSYNNWLWRLAEGVGLTNLGGDDPRVAGAQRSTSARSGSSSTSSDIYRRHTFTLRGEGRLEQIAEFLRRFHRTDYLHNIQRVTPRTIASRPGMFSVSFVIEVLALPQVREVNPLSSSRDAAPVTDEEREKMDRITNRSLLSEYSPAPRQSTAGNEQTVSPPPPFEHIPFCHVIAITESDGKPQTGINIRTTGRTYYLFEGDSFTVDDVQCTIKKINLERQQIIVEAEGLLLSVRAGQNFDDCEVYEESAEQND